MPRDDHIRVELPAGDRGKPATVWLVAYDDRHTARITAGENSGATITYTNVVRSLRPVGSWDGRAKTMDIDISADRRAGYGNCAILVQAADGGPILGAVSVPMTGGAR